MNQFRIALFVAAIALVGCATMGPPYTPVPPSPQGKATVHFMRSSVGFGGAWPTVFSVNDVAAVSLYDKGYSFIYLDGGVYRFSGGTHVNKDYLKFDAPVVAGSEYFIEYNQESAGNNMVNNRIRMVRPDEARAIVAKYAYKAANPVEIPNKTPIASSADAAKISEAFYVKSLAVRNKCNVIGEPKMSLKPASSNRLYEVACEGNTMTFECGPLLQDGSNPSCWLM